MYNSRSSKLLPCIINLSLQPSPSPIPLLLVKRKGKLLVAFVAVQTGTLYGRDYGINIHPEMRWVNGQRSELAKHCLSDGTSLLEVLTQSTVDLVTRLVTPLLVSHSLQPPPITSSPCFPCSLLTHVCVEETGRNPCKLCVPTPSSAVSLYLCSNGQHHFLTIKYKG